MIKTKQKIVFEYQKEKLFEKISTAEKYKQFRELELYLDKIWKSKDRSKFYYKSASSEEEEIGIRQRFLDLDYKDFSVTASKYVGIIQFRDIRLTLLPKFFSEYTADNDKNIIDKASRDLMYFLKYAFNLKTSHITQAPFDQNTKMDFFEIFTYLFAKKTLESYEHNFYHCYQTVSENLNYVKGKILFPQQVKNNLLKGRNEKIYCEYSVFQENNQFNQIVKFVATMLFHKTANRVNRNLLRSILRIFSEVEFVNCTYADTEKIHFNRTQLEFIPILNYCKLFLKNSMITFNDNKLEIFSFLLDMNMLFEMFVGGFLKKHFTEFKVEIQKSDLTVAKDANGSNVFRMKHDILLTINDRMIIIDTKYKETNFKENKGGISQADVYQMATYAIRRGCKEVILIYPKFYGDKSTDDLQYYIKDEFSTDVVSLRCCKLDLSNLPLMEKDKDGVVKKRLENIINNTTP